MDVIKMFHEEFHWGQNNVNDKKAIALALVDNEKCIKACFQILYLDM